jgi:hypothetical protein
MKIAKTLYLLTLILHFFQRFFYHMSITSVLTVKKHEHLNYFEKKLRF